MKKLAKAIILVAVLALVFFGCESDTDNGGGEAPLNKLFLTTSDYQTGGIGLIDLDSLSPWEPDPAWAKDVASADAIPVAFQQRIFVINRMPTDSISVLEFDENNQLKLVNQYSVKGDETNANPYDLAFITSERAYLTRYGSSQLWVINPESGELIKTIDLSQYADEDGIPEMAFMLVRGFYVYVSIQRLDEDNWWIPVGDSYLIKISWLNDQIAGKIPLSSTNPITDLVWNSELGKILVGEAGNYDELDGGIDGIAPATEQAQMLVSEAELGGDLTDFVLVSSQKGYAIVTLTDYSASKVVEFNPSTGEVINSEVYKTGPWELFDLALDEQGRLFIADRNATSPGVIVIDTSNNQLLTSEPINFSLPPYYMTAIK